MKHLFDLNDFFSFLSTQSLILSARQEEQFKKYQALLISWSRKQNLVSANDLNHLVERHFLSSAYGSVCLPEQFSGKIIDIGSGAGFPGIVLKILRPEMSLTLLDSSRKKVLFLEEVCDLLSLDCQVICQRCEAYELKQSDSFEIIVSRAVARLKVLWGWAGHLLQKGGQLYAFKGGDYREELDDLAGLNLRAEVLVPGPDWLNITDYLHEKYIIKLEK